MSDQVAGASLELRSAWLGAARDRLVDELDRVLGDALRLEGRRRPPWSEWVAISDFDLTGRCAGRFAHPDPDSSPRSATTLLTRALAKLALGAWDGTESPGSALRRVLPTITEPTWVVDALEELDPAARVAVQSSAEAWMADVLTSVRGRRDLRWQVARSRVEVPGRSIRLAAACDARLGDPRRPTTLLVHSGRLPDDAHDAVVAGFVSLVVCFWGRAVPERVRLSSAGTGIARRVVVTPEVLDRGVDRIVELASHRAVPDAAPLTPGGWCRWCHRLEDCTVGRVHLEPGA